MINPFCLRFGLFCTGEMQNISALPAGSELLEGGLKVGIHPKNTVKFQGILQVLFHLYFEAGVFNLNVSGDGDFSCHAASAQRSSLQDK